MVSPRQNNSFLLIQKAPIVSIGAFFEAHKQKYRNWELAE